MSIGPSSPNVALVAKLVAKPDQADEVSTFLADAVRLANQEDGTIAWFALRTDASTFWIVDVFASERDRGRHLDGATFSAVLDRRERLLDEPPEILRAEVLAAKLPKSSIGDDWAVHGF
jgi:quinol monooxygenase YgiN